MSATTPTQEGGSRISDTEAASAVVASLRLFRWSTVILLATGWLAMLAPGLPTRLWLLAVLMILGSLVCYGAMRWWTSIGLQRCTSQIMISLIGTTLYSMAPFPVVIYWLEADAWSFARVVLWPSQLSVAFLGGLYLRRHISARSSGWLASYPRLTPLGIGAVVLSPALIGGLLLIRPASTPLGTTLPASAQEVCRVAWQTSPVTATVILVWMWIDLAVDEVRLRRLIRQGRCLECGYQRHGLPHGAACPECGHKP